MEHSYPDYSLYGITDTAYGFLSKGCPRGCGFCHVADKEGKRSRKVADVSEFWQGQKYIKLLDPNILACPDWADLFGQLAGTKARIDITQGLDARLLSEDKVEALNSLKLDSVHFAWDRYEDSDKIVKGLRFYAKKAKNKIRGQYGTVYILVNYDTSEKQDLERIYTVRDLGYDPYVMIYNKASASERYKAMQRWANNPWIFHSCPDFRDYSRKSSSPN